MRCYLIYAFGSLLSFNTIAQQSYLLYSPDSSIRLEVGAKEKLSWHLYSGKELLIHSSNIDLQLKNQKRLSGNLIISSHRYTKANETIIVPVPYRKKTIIDKYNQLELIFKEPFSVQFRLYNEGMAYRIGTRFKDSMIIENENALFEVDGNASIWFAHMDKRQNADRFHTSFEAIYAKQILSTIPDTMLTYAPVTISLANGYHLAISDAGLFDYPGMFLQKKGHGLQGVFAPFAAKEKLMFPWRAVLIAKKDIDLPANDLLYILGDKSQVDDVSWIRYGKGTDEWITGINLFNIPFKAGLNTATYKYYIDFAKRFGFDQVMLDAGWSDVKDLFKINPDIDMNELL